MKKEMKMLDNGNYEEVISPIQHECRSIDYIWSCIEYGWELGILNLRIEDGDSYEDGFSATIKVIACPFCGYIPNEKKINIQVCEKCSVEDQESFFCRCEMRNIEIAKLLREGGKSPWKK